MSWIQDFLILLDLKEDQGMVTDAARTWTSKFLRPLPSHGPTNGHGDCCGDGPGYGNGNGYGDGPGYGNGNGLGDVFGDGDGNGLGNGLDGSGDGP